MVAEVAAVEPDDSSYLELSPDGQRVAVQRVVDNNLDVWLIDLERGGSSRFTYDSATTNYNLVADGAWIAFSSNRKGRNNLSRVGRRSARERGIGARHTEQKTAPALVRRMVDFSCI